MAALQLEDKLTCAICLGLYQDPATLPCGHNFCKACIQNCWRSCQKECPECRQPFPDGAEPCRNVALSDLLEMLRPGPGAGAGPGAGPGADPGARARCPHHGRPLELFCRTEGRCVCSVCTVQDCGLHERALLEAERREREVTPPGRPGGARPGHPDAPPVPTQSAACTLASVVSGKFSCLLQALEMRRASALKGIETSKTQALTQAREEEQRLHNHLEALAQYGHRVQGLLEQVDDQTFLQESQLLFEPPEPLGPLTPPQWDEDQQLGDLKELLSLLCGLLLEEGNPPRVPAKAANSGPMEVPGPLALVSSTPMCPLRRKLWQNYRNLTFDPDSANRHLRLSHQNQQVKHHRQPRGPARPGSFELWQVQCSQSFQAGRHYWEVRASGHSVTLGVAYPELTRHKQGTHTDNIGRGPSSWGLCVQEDSIQAWHEGAAQRLPSLSGRLVGMDLDLTSGCLTFYSLEPQTKLLHTFHALFSRPLCPVFWLLEGRTLTLCHQPGAKLPPGSQGETSGFN
ncbi:tripartite motif-containing protein 65 isoform X2 [Sciurus carolinensis]|uniref:tripartite motif-containing protein 65 isoform X2 n=1 Tax=Sciurus carolinensis TaxID=30640 RepID=UPI001FB2020E|nr:tripartite motif-containing protein 65 isoform X2 [Sciurus carolinensis]